MQSFLSNGRNWHPDLCSLFILMLDVIDFVLAPVVQRLIFLIKVLSLAFQKTKNSEHCKWSRELNAWMWRIEAEE